MNKKFLNAILCGALLLGSTGAFVACSDYDDDITNLQQQIDGIKVSLQELQALVNGGSVITSVTSTEDGITVELSNGNKYTVTNGKDGADGAQGATGEAGKDADVWTIGEDGYWYKNGEKTDYKAVGTDGKDGQDGQDGQDGADGQDGKPGSVVTIGENGNWFIDDTDTGISAIGQPGKDGQDGQDGKDGVDGLTPYIGENGNWWIGDKDTGVRAKAQDGGEAGQDGQDGEDGKDGKNGQYYVPNVETGCFDIYQDGELVEATNIRWRYDDAMSAIFTGGKLTFFGIDGVGAEGATVLVGNQLGSIAFVPEVISNVVSYPTTTKPFYHIPTYFDEKQYVGSRHDFISIYQNKSNVVELGYRLNPTDAYVGEMAIASFINRDVQTRAIAADQKDLLNAVSYETVNDLLSVKATINNRNLAGNGKHDLAALQMWVDQVPFTSDYIYATSEGVSVFLADSATMVALPTAGVKHLYHRAASIDKGEKDAFVKRFVPLTAANQQSATFKYDKSLDLKTIVGLWAYNNNIADWAKNLDFTGVSYKFSLPKEYIGDDGETNQQWFVKLSEDGILSANEENLTTGLTPAIGRTPVVRVDAFMKDNAGNSHMVATAYIKCKILEGDPATPQDKYEYTIDDARQNGQYEYHNLKASGNATTIANMPWEELNKKLYGNTGLSSTSFWNVYGGTNDVYDLKVTTTGKNGSTVTVLDAADIPSDQTWTITQSGFDFQILLNATSTGTSYINVAINNEILTENSYKDVNGKGAEYKVTLTIKSDDDTQRGDFILYETFYVREDCKAFDYNQLYWMGSFDGHTGDFVNTKGQLDATTGWEMSSYIGEHFAKVDGDDIFTYYAGINNVQAGGLSFKISDVKDDVVNVASTDIAAINAANEVALKTELAKPYEIVRVDYTTKLINNESCDFKYYVVFQNPFVNASDKGTTLYGNGIGTNTVDVKPYVAVETTDGDDIYTYTKNNKLELSKIATDNYKITNEPVVTYAFKKDAAYNNLVSQISNQSKLEVNQTTGVVTWQNQGTSLVADHQLTVIATVKFAGISVVTCEIPVTLTKERQN